MRISDLSRQSGVPVATIKFYLRERLLPPGVPRARNQAEYDDAHLRRLWLIRAFAGIGQLDLSSVRGLLMAIDNEGLPLDSLYDTVNRAVFAGEAAFGDDLGVDRARRGVDDFIDTLGWNVEPDAEARGTLAQVVAALKRLGCEYEVDAFAPFALAAEQIAATELGLVPDDCIGDERAAAAVRSVLFGVAFAAMRRMAQEHHLARRLKGVSAGSQSA